MARRVCTVLILFTSAFHFQETESCKIELNSSNFKRVYESTAFVDKTMFLTHLMKDHNHVAITAPKGFGKSTILNMAASFFETSTDALGNSLDSAKSDYYEIFTCPNVKISNFSSLIKKNFGMFPVLSLDFNEIESHNTTIFLDSFRGFLKRVFSKFAYLEESKNLKSVDVYKFKTLRLAVKNLEVDSLVGFGKILMRMLFEHHRSKCVLLIDNYDIPLWRALESGNITEAETIIKDIVLFVGRMVKMNDKYVVKSLLTGCRRPAEKYLTAADTLQHYSIFDESPYHEFYGFTESELKDLLEKFNISAAELKLNERDSVFDGNRRIYNTTSVLNQLEKKISEVKLIIGPD